VDWPGQPEQQARQAAAAEFRRHFHTRPMTVAFAPGRINLIGEHIDYAGGSVLPFAIQRGIAIAADVDFEERPPGQTGTAYRLNLHIAPDSPVLPGATQLATAHGLADAVLVRLLPLLGWDDASAADGPVRELRYCIYSDLPLGAGLSSSAAFAVALAAATLGLGGGCIGPLALCELCLAAEQAATGVQCGLMDQYAIVFGKAGMALHFDPVGKSHADVALALPQARLVVIDSGQQRELAATAYNLRRQELETARATFSGAREELADLSSPGTRRLRHLVHEQARVFAMRQALEQGDAQVAAELLNLSQASLRDLYEVSTPQLDLLCRLLTETQLHPGKPLAWGARLVGAGFGGCVLALVPAQTLAARPGQPRPIQAVLEAYTAATGLTPWLLEATPSPGASVSLYRNSAVGPRLSTELLRSWARYDQ
jgi:galactokinase